MPNIAQTVTDRLKRVQTRLHNAAHTAGRDSSDIQLLAVSKTKAAELIWQAYEVGQLDFGENYLQEALEKQQLLAQQHPGNRICWHFIGPIQSNKTRAIAENFSWVHSVDRLKIAQRLSDQRPAELPALNICLQVNLDKEDSKSGFSREELLDNAQQIAKLPRLSLKGLMAIPKPQAEPQAQLQSLKRLQRLQDQLNDQLNDQQLDTLSMGMSSDLEAAVLAGSTMVRVGSDIFGPRSPNAKTT